MSIARRAMHDDHRIDNPALCILAGLSDGSIMQTKIRQRGLAALERKIVDDIVTFHRGWIVRSLCYAPRIKKA